MKQSGPGQTEPDLRMVDRRQHPFVLPDRKVGPPGVHPGSAGVEEQLGCVGIQLGGLLVAEGDLVGLGQSPIGGGQVHVGVASHGRGGFGAHLARRHLPQQGDRSDGPTLAHQPPPAQQIVGPFQRQP